MSDASDPGIGLQELRPPTRLQLISLLRTVEQRWALVDPYVELVWIEPLGVTAVAVARRLALLAAATAAVACGRPVRPSRCSWPARSRRAAVATGERLLRAGSEAVSGGVDSARLALAWPAMFRVRGFGSARFSERGTFAGSPPGNLRSDASAADPNIWFECKCRLSIQVKSSFRLA
ncbi:hypothetical protein [Desertimonas flava]|uniref:hypothetical protein n=1 Tax=Desertimonas flava TaxID=2064846 RepID=UPI000E355F9D|nr:hypothetical protein [Desertimonas flava]